MMGAKESMSLISIKGQKAAVTGQQYWRSLDHLAEKPEFRKWVDQEFPAGASEMLTGALAPPHDEVHGGVLRARRSGSLPPS